MGGIVGFTLLTLICYLFMVINMPFLIIPITLIIAMLVIKPSIKILKNIRFELDLKTIITLLVFVIGILGQLAIISPSGVFKNGDILFWSSNGHDGMWHIAVMEEMKKNYPWQNPIFAGEKLVNYHFFSDILPSITHRYLKISNLNLYFRIYPFIYSLFLGASVYFLTKRLSNKPNAPIWATIFTYFAGSFGYIVTYIKNNTIGGESIFWATQPQSASGNPPQIISNFIIISAIYFYILLKEQHSRNKKIIYSLICILLFGTLVSFKVYAGIIALSALGLVGLLEFIKTKRINTLIITFISGLLSMALYFPNMSGSASFIIFHPWWYIRTMVVEPSRLNWIDLELRRQFYLDRGGIKSILRIIEYEGVAFLIFFFGNLGMRFLGLKEFLKTHAFIKTAVILSLILPMLFIQKGVASNTSQFLQYFVLFFGILAGIQLSKIPNKLQKITAPLIVILMIPTQIGLIKEFYSRPAFAKIDAEEIEALNYISDNTSKDSIIITPPYNQYLDLKDSTPNIWDWFDTSYVSALTSRRTYFDDYEQVDIMGYNWKKRMDVKNAVFNEIEVSLAEKAFIESGAQILYYPKIVSPKVSPDNYGLTKIFMNDAVEVWTTN